MYLGGNSHRVKKSMKIGGTKKKKLGHIEEGNTFSPTSPKTSNCNRIHKFVRDDNHSSSLNTSLLLCAEHRSQTRQPFNPMKNVHAECYMLRMQHTHTCGVYLCLSFFVLVLKLIAHLCSVAHKLQWISSIYQ